MSRFLLLNFEDFGLNQDITKTIQPNTPVCICCLDKTSPLINLVTCFHSDYLNYFTKPPELKPHNQVVCYKCHSVLVKIKQFKQQVENSFNILMAETISPQPVPKMSKVLTYHKTVDVLLTNNVNERKTVTIDEDKMKNIQTGLDIINKNNENASILGVLARGLETLKNISIGNLGPHEPTLKDNDETDINLIKEEPEKVPNVCNELGNLYTIKEEIDVDMESSIDLVTEQLQTTKEHDEIVRTVTITKEELMKERTLKAQSKCYKNLIYHCEYCLIGFNYRENYEDHVIRKHQGGSIMCAVCHQVLPSTKSRKSHMKRHYTRYECSVCKRRFVGYSDAAYHYKQRHTVKEDHKCRFCNFTTDVLDKLRLHSLKRHKVTCKICRKLFINDKILSLHMATKHIKKRKKYKCNKCPQSFSKKLERKIHNDIQHVMKYNIKESKFNSFICAFCHRIYKFKCNLEKHLQTHYKKVQP